MAIYAGSRMRSAAAVSDPRMLASMMASVLIVHRDGLQPAGDRRWRLRLSPLQQALGLTIRNWSCFDERSTPSAARVPCFSGVLLPGGQVLTSLHGRRGSPAATLLRDLRFLLAYSGEGEAAASQHFVEGETLLRASAVSCGGAGLALQDWALFALAADRGVLPPPARLGLHDPPPGTALYLTGFPFGMPLRVSDGGCWLAGGAPGEFRTRLNAFRCQSGGGIFDAVSHRLAGWLIAGQRDLRPVAGAAGEFEWCEFGAADPEAAETGCSVQLLPAHCLPER